MLFAQQLGQLGVGVGRVGLVAGDHLDLAAPQAGGDLELVEAGDGIFGAAQGFGQSRFGQPEHPEGLLPVDRPAGDRLLRRGGLNCVLPHGL